MSTATTFFDVKMGIPADDSAATNKPSETEPAPRAVDSSELFQGSKILLIRHAGSEYRLTITRNDKLILQK